MKKMGRSLLDYACYSGPNYDLWRPKIVQALLHNGADTNTKFHEYSPWTDVLVARPDGWDSFHTRILILNEMLLHGSDPNVCITKVVWLNMDELRGTTRS
jgi:ankyrin repeat protein